MTLKFIYAILVLTNIFVLKIICHQLENKTEKSKKLETSNKNSEKSNGKHSGKKHANSTNKSLPVSAKKPCLLHGTHSHTTDECKVMKEHVQ